MRARTLLTHMRPCDPKGPCLPFDLLWKPIRVVPHEHVTQICSPYQTPIKGKTKTKKIRKHAQHSHTKRTTACKCVSDGTALCLFSPTQGSNLCQMTKELKLPSDSTACGCEPTLHISLRCQTVSAVLRARNSSGSMRFHVSLFDL